MIFIAPTSGKNQGAFAAGYLKGVVKADRK